MRSSYSGVLYYNKSADTYVYANRGTNPIDVRDWVNNYQQGQGKGSRQYSIAIENAKLLSSALANLEFTGHSLGGGLAIAQALVTNRKAIVFNNADVHLNTIAEFDSDFSNARNLITSYIVEGEALNHFAKKAPDLANADDIFNKIPDVRFIRAKLGEVPQNQGKQYTLGAFNLGFNGHTAVFNPVQGKIGIMERVNLHGMPQVITGIVHSFTISLDTVLAGGYYPKD